MREDVKKNTCPGCGAEIDIRRKHVTNKVVRPVANKRVKPL